MFGFFDQADRHLLAVVAVWIVVGTVGLLGGAMVLGVAWRLMLWAAGLGQ